MVLTERDVQRWRKNIFRERRMTDALYKKIANISHMDIGDFAFV